MTNKEYEELVNSFKIGDRVEVIRHSDHRYGEYGVIVDIKHDMYAFRFFLVKLDSGWICNFYAEDLKNWSEEERKNV